ncbi:hypothetical protein [Nocardia rhizosphaerae]|uniref:Uncharacterized protein n=1 Tax=Nocardia rhizosphaerae TaxID=1691571 RepID=A0ABV8KY83_9NOCA
MRPDPQAGSDPVVHVLQNPRFVNQADGTVRAYYPGDDWFVVGTDRQDAIRLLHAEFDRRMQDPAYVAAHWDRTQRHRDGLEATPGFEVTEISRSEYEHRTSGLGDQLRGTADAED